MTVNRHFTLGSAEHFIPPYSYTEITSNIYVHIFKEYKAKMAESIEHDLL